VLSTLPLPLYKQAVTEQQKTDFDTNNNTTHAKDEDR